MKIFILGTGKTGTTALVYKVAGGLPGCLAFSGGRPGKYVGDYEHAVYKHTIEPRKGKNFEVFQDHLKNEHYDRKIWISRDPRDAAVSRMLYRWHKGYVWQKKQYEAHLERVLQKENDPASIPFFEIVRYTGHNGWPVSKTAVFEDERQRYADMAAFVRTLGDDWFFFTFEDMVAGKFDALNQYLGFEVSGGAEVPRGTGKDKVVRKKGTGDWRHWFTREDVELLKPAYLPYMELIGYDLDDWTLADSPVIDPQFSSIYMQSLPPKATRNIVLRYLDPLLQRLRKSG